MRQPLEEALPAIRPRRMASASASTSSKAAWEGSAAALSDALRDAGLDTCDGLRGGVVEQVEKLVVQWVAKVGIAEGLSEEQAVAASAKLLLLGSYALGAMLPGADVDVAAVVPYFVERRHFFDDGGTSGTLLALLRAQPDLTGLQPLPHAFVPVIKFELRGVPVDLLLVRLKLPQIPAGLSAETEQLIGRCLEEVDVPSSRLTRRPPSPAAAPRGHPCHSHGSARFPSS